MSEQSGEVTIVGAGARLEGTVVSAGSLRIDGQVKGQINADGDVTLSPSSQVEADIRAQNVSIGGGNTAKASLVTVNYPFSFIVLNPVARLISGPTTLGSAFTMVATAEMRNETQ